ncbi:MAG: Crp/Fnr family transcriptional regulator [Lachnospiraceae bacterium]|jgi:CRP-like cAMP-binding protein|nr:Crp/Fnr family transcriptional regulator [Lachnospiraceae bacterium]
MTEGLALFKEVAPDTLQKLRKYGKIQEFPKGSLIIRAKEPLEQIYIQIDGKSIVYNLTHTGNRKILFIFGRGALLNEHVLNEHHSATYCETIEKSRIFIIPADRFVRCMQQDFALTRAVLAAQERKVWRLGHQLKNTMGSIYMERRLAAKLWKLARDFGVNVPEGIEININLSVTFLADMLGTPRETASRLCRTLVDYRLIQMKGKRIIIINPQRISAFYRTGEIQ